MRCATNPCGTLHSPNPRWGCYNYEVIKVEHQMTATQVQFDIEIQGFIDELIENNYCEDDIYDFIDEQGEQNLINYYEEYVKFGEQYSYDAVDAFVAEFGIADIESFEDAYRGAYESKGDYAEQFISDCYAVEIPGFVEIDWEATFNNMDCVYADGFVFDTNY